MISVFVNLKKASGMVRGFVNLEEASGMISGCGQMMSQLIPSSNWKNWKCGALSLPCLACPRY